MQEREPARTSWSPARPPALAQHGQLCIISGRDVTVVVGGGNQVQIISNPDGVSSRANVNESGNWWWACGGLQRPDHVRRDEILKEEVKDDSQAKQHVGKWRAVGGWGVASVWALTSRMTVTVLIRLLDVTLVLGNYVSNVSRFPDISRRRATYANRLTGAWSGS